jgi:hypothetical protein
LPTLVIAFSNSCSPRPKDASLPRAAPERSAGVPDKRSLVGWSKAPRVQPHRTSGVGPVLSEAVARVDEAKKKFPKSEPLTNRSRHIRHARFRVSPASAGRFPLCRRPLLLLLLIELRPKDVSASWNCIRRRLPLHRRPLLIFYFLLKCVRRTLSLCRRRALALALSPLLGRSCCCFPISHRSAGPPCRAQRLSGVRLRECSLTARVEWAPCSAKR